MEDLIKKVLANQLEMNRNIVEMRGDISKLQQGQEEMRADIRELQQGQEEMRADIRELQQGQEEMRADIRELQQGQKRLENRISNLEKKLDANLADIAENFRDFSKAISRIPGYRIISKQNRAL